jgi:hypothetical protein
MTALYSPLGHTHRCGICERLYTCSKRHASAKTQYRCEDCGKRSEDLRLPASIPSANLDGFYYGPRVIRFRRAKTPARNTGVQPDLGLPGMPIGIHASPRLRDP